ncbi:MAG: Gfo/Idh/MocA family oxidoreductase [Terrabacter sp.]|nr:Gfo/Idh/MocA family oxidoreductase [Dermatophilaceae bacterium]NUO90810.1 Gfo/Idh/MocA family oxidoreductase [Dermatophilaceae bacterium]NUR82427.1 Gfo/Idh/MocA family oxidoreductase [Dermatophilaceae bacterium]NUS41120.1 Gfo/Idh/MocA family oxidoreductase [Terrabacter sp.]
MTVQDPVRIGLIGCGRIGTHHATTLSRRLAEADLVAVADPFEANARRLGGHLGVEWLTEPQALIDDDRIEAVAITCASTAHADLVVAVAKAGKAVFVEKPMAMTLADADRAIAAAEAAGIPLQVGFNRRFARDFAVAHEAVATGRIGTPQLLRSLTRDPGLADPGAVPPWTIFTQTLIHDFDALNWFNAGARAVEVSVMADALVAPDFKDRGLLDTAVVTIRYDNGAIAVAEASFSAAYGYDVRGEVFGSAGMVQAGSPAHLTTSLWTADGVAVPTARQDTDLMDDAYAAELAAFCRTVREGGPTPVGGHDARAALRIALACIESCETGSTVAVRDADREVVS